MNSWKSSWIEQDKGIESTKSRKAAQCLAL